MRVLIERPWTAPYRVEVGQRDVAFVYLRRPRVRRLGEWTDAFIPVVRQDVDLVHMTNSVPLPPVRPFVLSFEDCCPRVPDDRYIGWLEHAMARILAGSRCRAIMPWSEYARRQAQHQMDRYPSFGGDVMRKMRVVPPAVELRTDRPKVRHDPPKLVFVGREFWRKGGVSVVRAHQRLRRLGIPVETVVVSAFDATPARYVRIPPGYEKDALPLDEPGLTVHERLSNDDVLALVDRATYLVLPTLHDTYGYSAAEALASGTPAISTGTAAQPEVVVDGVTGWLLPLENDPVVGKWLWVQRGDQPGYDDAFAAAVDTLTDSLVDAIVQHMDRPADEYAAMSQGAIDHVRTRMSTEVVRGVLEDVYRDALA